MKKGDAFSQDFFKDFSEEMLFRVLLNQVDYSVCFKDKEHRYMLCSSSFARLLGYKTPRFAVDDNPETKWCDNSAKPEKFIAFDLGRVKTLTRWTVLHAASESQSYVTKAFALQVRNSEDEPWRTVDEVTGLYNRKYFEEMVKRNMRLFSRVRGRGYSAGFTIVLMDINHFTKFCTEHGPETGDIVLQYIADILRSSTRCADDVFRVGNDEFALLLSDTALSGAKTLSARINEKLKKKPLVIDEEKYSFTMCYGYSTYDDQLDASELIQDADQSLFEARKKRKN